MRTDYGFTSWFRLGARRDALLLALLLSLIGCIYHRSIPANFRGFSAGPGGYYGLLTEAFLHGQLHVRIEPDPKLLALANPYAGAQGASRPHDMSYYRGKFYLYYGATPALILYLPLRVLTGSYVSEPAGITFMIYSGLVVAALGLAAIRRRWFLDLPVGWLLLFVAVLAFSPPLGTEMLNTTFYLVPLAGGFLCAILTLSAVHFAIRARTLRGQALWLALASLGGGLAVGARPTYILGLGALAIPAFALWWRSGRAARGSWQGLQLLVAVTLPAAVVGMGLASYNYLRFENFADFGIRFSMASGDLREMRLVGAEFIPKNLHQYLLKSADWSRYFPFLFTSGRPWGLLPHLPFVMIGLLFPLTWFDTRLRHREWVLLGSVALAWALVNFGVLCFFFGDEERYFVDFVPLLAVLASAVIMAALTSTRRRRPRWYGVGGTTAVLLAGYAVFTGLMLISSRENYSGKLARMLNTPTHWLEQRAGATHGPIELELEFPRNRAGRNEPLVATGLGREAGDVISVRYLDAAHVQFSAFHVGRGGPMSEPIEVDYSQTHRVIIELGSLYPPAEHPIFSDWSPAQVLRARRRLKITMDNRTVLQGNFTVYPSTPANIRIGAGSIPHDVADPRFTGRIMSQKRMGLVQSDTWGEEIKFGPVRLTVRFPVRTGDEGLPLLSTGQTGNGDLVFAQLTKEGGVRFGHDSWGAGAIFTPVVPFNPAEDHQIEIGMGSLYPGDSSIQPLSAQRHLRITFDGNLLYDHARAFNPSTPDQVEYGFNATKASSAIDYFSGTIRRIESIPPAGPNRSKWGHLKLVILFSGGAASRAEPLLITGHTGRADVLFVRYEPDGSVRFGLDHWGVSAEISAPVAVDRTQPYRLEVRSRALLPPDESEDWVTRNRGAASVPFEVLLNGQTVFAPKITPFVNPSAEIAIGINRIEASTCEQAFTGKFLAIDRAQW